MRIILIAILILFSNYFNAQCGITSSVTLPSSSCACDGSVTFYLNPSCTNFPYKLNVNGGTCITSGTFTVNSSSFVLPALCQITCNVNAILTTSLNNPIGFTNFSVPGGGTNPVSLTTTVAPASCSVCCDGAITSFNFGGTPPFSYTLSSSTNSNIATLINLCPNSYTLCLRDNNGCSACKTFTIGFPASLKELMDTQPVIQIKNRMLSISNSDSEVYLEIYEIDGKLIYRNSEKQPIQVFLSPELFKSGIYIVNIHGKKQTYRQKFLIE